jgi:DNA-binding transcriptional MerR regulator
MRSGAVARLLRMPVATLRVWERRYALTKTDVSPGGHRLYSTSDVQRLALLKQATELGHSIALVAPLGVVELRRLAATHAQATPIPRSATRRAHAPERPWRLAVVGAALAARLDQPAWRKRFGSAITLLGPFANAA